MNREKKIVKVSMIVIMLNIMLVIFKSIIGLITNSIAIILDAVNNLTDVISSVVTIVGTKLANKPADRQHPYGHGRIEYFASIIISMIILFAGFSAIKESIEKIINPVKTEYSLVSIFIIAVAVVVKFFMGKKVKKSGEKLNSNSLIASGQDAFMDSALSFTTLVAAILNYIFRISIEGYLGVLISLLILKSGFDVLKITTSSMIGERADKALTDKIKAKVLSYKEVEGAFDLVLHNYGPSNTIGTIHIQVRDDMTAKEIHALTRQITIDVFNEFGIIITVGIYASNYKGEFSELRNYLDSVLLENKEVKQMHGFYVDKENFNVFFDLIIDFEIKDTEAVKNKIIKKMTEKYPAYKFNIYIDADITD